MPKRERSSNGARPLPFEFNLLTPAYEPAHHEIYLSLLDAALAEPDVRNVALSGAYGTGKSSVLVGLTEAYSQEEQGVLARLTRITTAKRHKSLNISLSSMGLDTTADLTNQIQKEIVKQILYTVAPAKAPRSRFDRTSRGRKRDGLLLAALVGAAVAAAATLGRSIGSSVVHGFSNPTLAFVVTFLLSGAIAYLVRRMMGGRVSVDQVAAGPASISLSRAPTASYFDQYLDEIVYFFEVTQYDLVIFEDIDRFDDTGIFEALRSLNTLLNSAPQLRRKPVRFVYAMRDSLFQKLEDDLKEPTAHPDEAAKSHSGYTATKPHDVAAQDVQRANRTKFFDVVIPVVPFITRENARDIMTRAFRADGFGVSDRLLNIVARHIADMRLVTNIRNEFKVFHHHLIAGPHPVPELDADKLLAVVVYKNVHLQDFEKIRFGTSNLDVLYELGRDLVTHNVKERTQRIQDLRAALANQDAATYRSEMLGRRLHIVMGDLSAQITSPPYNQAVPQDLLTSTEFWRDVSAGVSKASVATRHGSWPITPQLAGVLLNEPLTAERWDTQARPQMERELANLERTVATLSRATWKVLFGSPRTPTASGETFTDATRRILGSELAADLVQHGYLDEYFSLNIAPFYAEQVSLNAMNFIQRNIDRGVSDLLYELTDADVSAVLSDRPNALEDVGAYNVTLLDHLLTKAPHHARTVITNVAKMGAEEIGMLSAYVEYGSMPGEFVEQLTPLWSSILAYLTEDVRVDVPRLRGMVDAALRAWSDEVTYELGSSVRSFIEADYRQLTSLCGASSNRRAAELAVSAGVIFADLDPVGEEALAPIKKARAYPVTASNLARATGLSSFSLDRLAANDDVVHATVLDRLSEYLHATGSEPTVEDPATFADVLGDVANLDEALIGAVVARANPECVLDDLTASPPSTWSALASHGRFVPNVANLNAYILSRSVDAPLVSLMETKGPIVDWDESETSRAVVVAIVGASEAIPDPAQRVDLVSEAPVARRLAGSEIPDERTSIVRMLLEHDLVDDAPATFAPTALSDPDAFASAVAASEEFRTFMSPAVLTVDRVDALMRHDEVDDTIKRAVVADLRSYLAGAPASACVALAEYSLSHDLVLDEAELATLQGSIPPSLMVRLLAGSDLAGGELVPHLRALGGVYADLVEHDGGKVQLPENEVHAQIANRLKAAAIVSRVRRDGKGNLNVWRHVETS
ncbi:YobI family P-loop NTPase [Cellulosimicrobium cellulans]|uniref:YobI family P-loop NTPase n=1 Tax=Cellulosimicrobium cellulans TaxID=1710 RepID=UPI00209712EA|nr:hypothetical protein [Cellulosimicrobium cellulans]MCO7275132.1 hypothetical protein [Cellulosimicrobium cellulans]